MKSAFRKTLWGLLGAAILLCVALELLPRPEAPSRLDQLPLRGFAFAGRDLPLNAAETAVFQRVRVLKRLYQAGDERFVLLAVDAHGDRHAIHDPLYCFNGAGWKITGEGQQELPGGYARELKLSKGGQTASALYWISDGRRRHASAWRAWLQSVRQRLHLAAGAPAPVLVLLQPATGSAVNWPELVDRCPELFAL